MTNIWQKRYEALAERIDQMETEHMMELAEAAFGKNRQLQSEENRRAITARVCTMRTALYSLRLLANVELLSTGDEQYAAQFQRDFMDVKDSLGWLIGMWNDSAELNAEAVDMILLTSEGSRQRLLMLLRSRFGVTVGTPSVRSSRLFSVGYGLLEFYLQEKMLQEAVEAAKGLVSLSERRCGTDRALHREVVVQVLLRLIDADWRCALQICEEQKRFFAGIENLYAADFYWFYGVTCHAGGRKEEALSLFLHCHRIYSAEQGEKSWFAARALSMYHRILLPADRNGESEAFLWDFLKKAENDYYTHMPEMAALDLAFVRYDILNAYLGRQRISECPDTLREHFEFCVEYEEVISEPRFTVRCALNMVGAFYLEQGDFLQAEQMMRDALETLPPKGVEKMPADDILLYNLLYLYVYMNDTEQMERWAPVLEEKLKNGTFPEWERDRCFAIVQSAYAMLGWDVTAQVEDYKKELREVCNAIRRGRTGEIESRYIDLYFGITARISALLDSMEADEEDLRCCEMILRYLLDHEGKFALNDAKLVLLYTELGRTCWQMERPEALEYFRKSLAYGRRLQEFNPSKLANMRIAAAAFYYFEEKDTALAIAEEALTHITGAWRNIVAYINDHRVGSILEAIQMSYGMVYALFRLEKDTSYLYDQLLRNKDLPALVGRERNRYLNDDRIDKQLLAKVYRLQDELANAQSADLLHGTNRVGEIYQELQEAETEFAENFPDNIRYTDISLQRLGARMKDDEAIVEYYFSISGALLTQTAEEEIAQLDIFVLTKKNGKLHLGYAQIANGEDILQDAIDFNDIMQNGQDSEQFGEKERLREKLYHALFDYALPRCSHAKTLYIAPDAELCNLPFEILYADGERELHERFQICRVACGRDLLFFEESPCGAGRPFVLGDPDFEAERGATSADTSRFVRGSFESVSSLPFSGVEAQRVARRCQTAPYVGRNATKYALRDALPCRIIHLATHGMFDASMESDSLYSSCLLFAGYNRWLRSKRQSEACGNGLLTADEISRMDLHNTELVVLSACNSGMGSYSTRSLKGLLSAFSAAGVRWIISHIWKANDFTTPILMDAFYYAYLTLGMDVPKALQYAKSYLRTVTIGQLRTAGWLNPDGEHLLSETIREELRRLRQAKDRLNPFQDESYWGGFVCYKCK